MDHERDLNEELVSARSSATKISAIKEMSILSTQVPGAASLAWGLPSFPTPKHIRTAVEKALTDDPKVGMYTLPAGLPELRAAVALEHERKTGIAVDPNRRITITSGNMEGLNTLFQVLIDPGDEIILTDPGFVSHIQQIRFHGGKPVFWKMEEGRGWELDIDALPVLIGPRTKGIVLVNPTNPTGRVLSESTLREVAAIGQKRGILVIIDDPYSAFVHDDHSLFFNLAAASEYSEDLAYFFTFSKAHAMSGWRVGYAVVPEFFRNEVVKIHDMAMICTPRISQVAAAAALTGDQAHLEEFKAILTRRRDLICDRLDRLAHVFSYARPQGAYYVFPRILTPHDTDKAFAANLLREARVTVTPGSAFGPSGASHIRMTYCVEDDVIDLAFDRMESHFGVEEQKKRQTMIQRADDQGEVIAFLSNPASHGASEPVEVIETHISVVFLIGKRAFKLKRSVDLPYAHFATPEVRCDTCKTEVVLNALTAPDLYLGVRRITRANSGGLEFDGGGTLKDCVVEMVRFDQESLFDHLAVVGQLTAPLMSDLARAIAGAHAQAPIVHASSGSDNLSAVLDINRAGFAVSKVFPVTDVAALDAAFRRRLERHSTVLDQREVSGLVRRCHGDLHLRNICMFGGRPTLFDCIDFNDQIATVDVLYDLAFLLMDLWHRDLRGLSNLVANHYFDSTDSDSGYELLPFLMAVRAAVRAHVTATFAEEVADGAQRQTQIARSYFDLARELLSANPAGVLAMGGYSGSGKTTVAEALASEFGAPPGARVVESDRTRKAMFGVPASKALPEEAYRPEVSDKVYRRLAERTHELAQAGADVVVDAVFERPERRSALEAAVAGRPFIGFWLTAAPDTLRQRVGRRLPGISDATLSVLEAQLARDLGPIEWAGIPADTEVIDVVEKIIAEYEAARPVTTIPPQP